MRLTVAWWSNLSRGELGWVSVRPSTANAAEAETKLGGQAIPALVAVGPPEEPALEVLGAAAMAAVMMPLLAFGRAETDLALFSQRARNR